MERTDPRVVPPAGAPSAHAAVAMLREQLAARWQPAPDRLAEICRYALLPAGKLLRPLLLFSSAEAAGGDTEAILPAALAVEYLHVASLVHDDVIDGDHIRRGRASVYALHGTNSAIVAGDALIFALFEAVTACEDRGIGAHAVVAAIRAFSRAGADLCRGQALEEALAGDLRCSVDRYLEMVALKTGALFTGACRAGALLAEAPDGWVRALTEFAEHLGLAFQIHDDLLGYTSSSAVTGKNGSSDVANRRPTLPVLFGYQLGGDADRKVIEAAMSGRLATEDAHGRLREILHGIGALELAEKRAGEEIHAARRRLDELPANHGTAKLAEIAGMAISEGRSP